MRRDRRAERRPHAVVVDARRHHEDEHVVAVELPGRQHLDLHGLVGRAVPLLADRPRVHLLRHVPERRNLADLVEVLLARRDRGCRGGAAAGGVMATTFAADAAAARPAPGRRCLAARADLGSRCHAAYSPHATAAAKAPRAHIALPKSPTDRSRAQANFCADCVAGPLSRPLTARAYASVPARRARRRKPAGQRSDDHELSRKSRT